MPNLVGGDGRGGWKFSLDLKGSRRGERRRELAQPKPMNWYVHHSHDDGGGIRP